MGQSSSSAAAAASRQPGPTLAHLPDAMIQSVCHSLAALEILALARASKQMLHAIDVPFAWMHSPLAVSMNLFRSPQMDARHRSGLCGRAPVSLVWTRLYSFVDASLFLSDLEVMECDFLSSSPPRIHELDLSDVRQTTQWIPLLLHPSCSALRVLRLFSTERSGVVPTAALETLRSLVHLHTLIIYPEKASTKHGDWSLLSQLPRLTSLETCNVEGPRVQSQLPSIVRCTNLRELRLAGFKHCHFELFEAVAPLSQLRLLWIDRDCNEDVVAHLPSRVRAACARMQALEELQFSTSQMLRLSLPFLVECKALRFLSLRRPIHTVGQEAAAVYCGPQLVALLSALPQCKFSLRVVVHCSVTPSHIQHFRRTFDQQCAVERTNQRKDNVPLAPPSVAARISIVMESARKAEGRAERHCFS